MQWSPVRVRDTIQHNYCSNEEFGKVALLKAHIQKNLPMTMQVDAPLIMFNEQLKRCKSWICWVLFN